MTIVRMLWDMQGGRYDGQRWPGYMKEIDVPQWEADELVSAKIAEYSDSPVLNRGFDVLRHPDLYFEENLKLADGGIVERSEEEEEPTALSSTDLGDDFDSDFDSDDFDSEVEEVTSQVKRPSTVDKKEAWIEWAVSKGADREKAAAKTKAMLIADY